jgi:thioredoxin 2
VTASYATKEKRLREKEQVADKLKVSCSHCGKTNYYPSAASGKKVICGHCKNPLPNPGAVIEPPVQKIQTILKNSSLPILIDFYSPTCAPCHVMHPVIENLARRRAGELMALRINVNSHPDMGVAFVVQGVPTFLIIRKGTEIARTTGAMSDTDFALWVASRI